MSFTRNLQQYLKQQKRYTIKCDTDNNNTGYKQHRFECNANAQFGDSIDSQQQQQWSSSIKDYHLLEQIGSGSFGQVFRATLHTRECAVKLIVKAKSPNIGKILSEVSIHIRLCHRHVLQLHNVLEDRFNVYLVMEMCHGGSLAQLINKQVSKMVKPVVGMSLPVLPYVLIVAILRQICSGLDYLHRHSILHRDLNLNNLLLVRPLDAPLSELAARSTDWLNQSIHIKIADFGLAINLNCCKQTAVECVSTSNTNTMSASMGTTICGTPGFISPEIWTQERTVSHKSDIFSLGSIVFACIAGYTPKGDIELNNFVPIAVDLISRLLDPDPDKRPELTQVMSHLFVSGRVDTRRLRPISKTTKHLRMSIDTKGRVELCFLKDRFTISTNSDGSVVYIKPPPPQTSPSAAPVVHQYSFYQLPVQYWKRYGYLVRFVSLVKAKTAKITIHCNDWFPADLENIDDPSQISRCALMENGHIEVTQYNKMHNKSNKFVFNYNQPQLESNLHKRLQAMQDVLKFERDIIEMGVRLKMDLFPVTFGHNFDQQLQVPDNIICNDDDDDNDNDDDDYDEHHNTSQVLHCKQIDGLGRVTQFTNGRIQMNFIDGVKLCMNNDMDSHIFYQDKNSNVPKRFIKTDPLPSPVLTKIAQMRLVIDHLRKSSSSPNTTIKHNDDHNTCSNTC